VAILSLLLLLLLILFSQLDGTRSWITITGRVFGPLLLDGRRAGSRSVILLCILAAEAHGGDLKLGLNAFGVALAEEI
jgi:uncharacterized membrane protein